jgi:polyprenyl P-hydroxybenzoate/phenylacrylic acid decarboxylase-like protein
MPDLGPPACSHAVRDIVNRERMLFSRAKDGGKPVTERQRRVVVAITGATGAIYGVRLLEELRRCGVETHFVMSRAGILNAAAELSLGRAQLEKLADVVYSERDIGAAIASGSFRVDGMVIAPCSMRTLAAIATGVTDNLVTRAADVALKERRRLVLVARETPLHLVHLRNMVTVTEMGGVIFPPVPAFYARLESIEDMVDQTVGRVLDLLGLDSPLVKRWAGLKAPTED